MTTAYAINKSAQSEIVYSAPFVTKHPTIDASSTSPNRNSGNRQKRITKFYSLGQANTNNATIDAADSLGRIDVTEIEAPVETPEGDTTMCKYIYRYN